ncbi:hypothetical protein DS901_08545 [Loktanella sp. D2R18]|nr:hypothetical protein DS901_08545 [Loktanella sp. D2R18]
MLCCAALAAAVCLSFAWARYSSAGSLADDHRAEEFAETIMTYVADTCPTPARDATMDEELLRLMEAPFGMGDESDEMQWLETLGKDSIASQMTDIDKRGLAIVFVGAFGIVEQLKYTNLLTDEDHLQSDNYLEVEAEQYGRALYLLDLMDCIWPSAEEVRNPPMASGLGEKGDELWRNVSRSIYTGNCPMEYLLFMRSYFETDFASILPDDRDAAYADLMRAHEHYTEPASVAERCEEFT